jgi:hypothetical protein
LEKFSHTDSHTGFCYLHAALIPHPYQLQLHDKPVSKIGKRPPLFNPTPFQPSPLKAPETAREPNVNTNVNTPGETIKKGRAPLKPIKTGKSPQPIP